MARVAEELIRYALSSLFVAIAVVWILPIFWVETLTFQEKLLIIFVINVIAGASAVLVIYFFKAGSTAAK